MNEVKQEKGKDKSANLDLKKEEKQKLLYQRSPPPPDEFIHVVQQSSIRKAACHGLPAEPVRLHRVAFGSRSTNLLQYTVLAS